MREYKVELEQRIAFIKEMLAKANASGIVYGNSGGKDSALVGILCRMACDNVLGVLMPCQSKRNFEEDTRDALEVAEKFDIKTIKVDLSDTKSELCAQVEKCMYLSDMAKANIAPRLRMATLYSVAQSTGCLVAGTGNRSEAYVGYYTKWGDGAHDFNPIADLTVTEVYEFLEYLDAPRCVIEKAPSAGLYEGQTDEGEMGLTYAQLDKYLLTGNGEPDIIEKIEKFHARSMHKAAMPVIFEKITD
jgi:NAD+ synthase